MNYTDPKTKKTHYGTSPVRQGPESVALETIHLPFWYGGDQYDNLDAGFGPYALSRLAMAPPAGSTSSPGWATGRLSFDPNAMREYRPDWVEPRSSTSSRPWMKDPIRGAVIQAAMITQQKLPGQPSALSFPAGRRRPSSRRRWPRQPGDPGRPDRVHRRRRPWCRSRPPSPSSATARPPGAGRRTMT